jgi:hypothetical protein
VKPARCRLRTTHTKEQVEWLQAVFPSDVFAFCEQHAGWHRVKLRT